MYGEALFRLGEACGSVQRTERDLAAVLDLLEHREDVGRFLADPRVETRGKAEALQRLLDPGIDSSLLHFLLILLEKGRLKDLRAIAEVFFKKAAAVRGSVSGELVSAAPLPEEKVAAVEREMGRVLGKTVRLRARVDPMILGGVAVRLGDTVVDGSVRRRLEAMRAHLLASVLRGSATGARA
jgi:F-type H+-transporting ATPase subunit delta